MPNETSDVTASAWRRAGAYAPPEGPPEERADSLSAVFGLTNLAAIEHSWLETVGAVAALRRAMPRGVPSNYWGAVLAEIGERVGQALDVPISDVLTRAWQAYGPFLKYCDRKRYPPEKVTVVPLLDHDITSSLDPYVELLVNGQPAGRVSLDVRLTITLNGGNLTIQDGRFMQLRLASGRVRGQLSCKGVVLVDRSSNEYHLPGTIRFGRGVPIVPFRSGTTGDAPPKIGAD